MKQCGYCAKEISYQEMYCSKECEEKYTAYFALRAKLQKLLSTVNILGTFLIAIGIFLSPLQDYVGLLMMGVGGLSVGLITLLLPTPTDNFISRFKMEKAVKIVRIFSVVLLAFGAVSLTMAVVNMF